MGAHQTSQERRGRMAERERRREKVGGKTGQGRERGTQRKRERERERERKIETFWIGVGEGMDREKGVMHDIGMKLRFDTNFT